MAGAGKDMLKDAALAALVVAVLALPLAGVRTIDGLNGLTVEWRLADVAIAATLVFIGRLFFALIKAQYGVWIAPCALFCAIVFAYLSFPSRFLQVAAVAGALALFVKALTSVVIARTGFSFKALFPKTNTAILNPTYISWALIVIALMFPLSPLGSRYVTDVAIMVMTYIVLAFGLNITVGYAGLLDLGYAGFYALGAYSFALLSHYTGVGFWTALPIAGLVATFAALLLGFPVLRLRGDYFALVTLGFGEIVRLVLINWSDFTNGPNGISGIPRPTLFGLEFARQSSGGAPLFHEFFQLTFEPMQRIVFLYYIILAILLAVGWIILRLRSLPLGRSWEAFREDEIACAALGINRTWIKLAAYSMGAFIAGIAGAFFAARQGFISPESFTFTESATMLAIVVLGGVGHPLGIVFAGIFILGLPELFRDLEQYRMLAFGAGMVLIMIWRPGGMMATRSPTIKLADS
jgi:branched-chain amino acid transport system permease protein